MMTTAKRYAHYCLLVEGTPQMMKCFPQMFVYVLAADFDRVTAERDALQLRLNAADQRIDELVSAVRSINHGRRHEVFVPGDDEPQYRQRKEWVDWVLSLCDEASASEPCHEIPDTSGMRLNMLAHQGE